MKSHKSTGLVCAGGVNQSFLARMPALLGRLGPVKGSSLRVSQRIANGIKAGFGTRTYEALEPCSLILLALPESNLDARSAELANAINLEGKVVVLCDALRDSFCPSPLRTAGAFVATLNCVPESDERVFVAEGHPRALSILKKLLEQDRRKLIELHPVTKTLFLSGVLLGAHLILPWIEGAVESLRAAGFSRTEATLAVHAMGSRALRAYAKAGRKARNDSAALELHQAILPELDALRRTDPHLAALYSIGANEVLRETVRSAKARPVRSEAAHKNALFEVEAV
jgi:predicted short-subunit dehydrogenase-like oxidoreductase (DUF2520 family)